MIAFLTTIFVFVVIYFTHSLWSKYIISVFSKGSKTIITRQKTGTAGIFAPSGTTRTFFIAIDITEKGDGTVEMTLAKLKTKDL